MGDRNPVPRSLAGRAASSSDCAPALQLNDQQWATRQSIQRWRASALVDIYDRPAAWSSESKPFTNKDRGDSARLYYAIDDQDVVYAAWYAISAASSIVLEWKAVLINASEACVDVGNDLL
jgi:hypothetical protein